MVIHLLQELAQARQAAGLSQAGLAERAGLSRMALQKLEAGSSDPRLSSVLELARALGMELMLVPASLRPELEDFVRAGGKYLGQPAGLEAPPSVVDELLRSSPGRGRAT